MTVFPLFMTNAYFNIQEVKTYFFLYSTMFVTGLVLMVTLCGSLLSIPWEGNTGSSNRRNKERKKNGRQNEISIRLPFLQRLRKQMVPTDWFAALFLIVVILSTLCSEWKYEAFWGNMGRHQGCFLLMWYMAAYALISRFYCPKQWHMDLFLAAAFIVCTWGILDQFWYSPIGWQVNAKRNEAFQFSSTIGNVNILTGLEGIYLLAASAMFIGQRSEKPQPGQTKRLFYICSARTAFYLLVAGAAFMSLVAGCSDNALLSVATAACFLPFFAFGSRKGILRYLLLLIVYIFTMLLMGFFLHRSKHDWSWQMWRWGELISFSYNHEDLVRKVLLLLVILFAAVYAVFRFMKVSATQSAEQSMAKTLRFIWGALGVMAAGILVWIFVDANTGGHPELYAPVRKLIVFDNDWGSHRGYNWRLLFKYFGDFPLIKKLLGSGPETYGIYTHVYDHYAMLDMFEETYDSPHNEWLQYLFTTGILGFVGYYGMVKCALWSGFGIGKRTYSYPGEDLLNQISLMGVALAYGIQAYTIQSFVNISVPITVPYVIMSIAICACIGRRKRSADQAGSETNI